MRHLENVDPEIYSSIVDELGRQRHKLEMIASENIVSQAVLEAQGSIMTNKYAEGYPHKRYYGGCEYVDVAEDLAISRARELFGAAYVNVQPHSGSQANMGAYFAFLETGDTVMGMDLSHGGHLTHGSPVNFSGRLYNFVHYGVDPATGRIDYDDVAELARKHRPRMIVAGASAYPRVIDFERFAAIAAEAGAYLMVDMAHIAGLVATGLHPSPIPFSDVVTTTTHKTLRGPRGGMILAKDDLSKQINKQIFPGIQGGPLMHVIAAKAVALKEAMSADFKTYQQQVVANAAALAQTLMDNGFELVSGGTDNHLMLVDLTNRDVTGKDAETWLDEAWITVNKNTVPNETRSPFVTSGVRIGTPALTTRGMQENEMRTIAALINRVVDSRGEATVLAKIRNEVRMLTEAFPLYQAL